MVPCGKSCQQTCSPGTRGRESSRNPEGPPAAQALWSSVMQLARCIPCLGDRTPPAPSQSVAVFAARGRSSRCVAWRHGALCPVRGRSPAPLTAHWCNTAHRSHAVLDTAPERQRQAPWSAPLWSGNDENIINDVQLLHRKPHKSSYTMRLKVWRARSVGMLSGNECVCVPDRHRKFTLMNTQAHPDDKPQAASW